MSAITIHEAKTNLSRLLKRVEAGEEIVIARGNKEIARLSPILEGKPKSRGFGSYRHIPPISDDALFAPLPDDELEAFEGGLGPDP